MLESEQIKPQTAASVRPICMSQFERLFNTTRRPGKNRDFIDHYDKSHHIVVFHKNRYFRLNCFGAEGRRIFSPAELEDKLEMIIKNTSAVQPGEEKIASLTAGSRDKWFDARMIHLQDDVNMQAIGEIETAAFFLVLEDKAYDISINSNNEKSDMNDLAKSLIHGNVCNRWFDKSFNIVVFENGACGLNGEHAWADAPVLGMTVEYFLWRDAQLGKFQNNPKLIIFQRNSFRL